MTLALLEDASKRPELFRWNGTVQMGALDRWLSERQWRVPDELRMLWIQTGGGAFYETETLLGPFGDPSLGDDVDSVNQHNHAQGLAPEFLVFHCGLGGLTAVNQQDQSIVQIDPKTFKPYSSFPTLDEWYSKAIRSEYASVYNLSVRPENS